jgi:hypothetical protein
MSASNRWTHAFLDAMRLEGDSLADAVIAHVVAEGGPGAVHGLLQRLFASQGLPAAVDAFLARATGEAQAVDAARLREAERLYARYRPEVRLVLGTYSLPAAYAARKGVQVLHRTTYLLKNPVRRLFETARFVDEVLAPGALLPGGRGASHLARVRLAHAASRFLIQQDAARPWDVEALGVPINQEDQAGTLMTFSFVVLEGLATLGLALSPAEQEAWLYAWRVAAPLLGLDARLVPADVAEARALTAFIRERQVDASPEGVALTAALMEGLQTLMPGVMRGLPASLVRFFLSPHVVRGRPVVELLELPESNWTVVVPRAFQGLNVLSGWVEARAPRAGRWVRGVRDGVAAQLVLEEPGGPRPPPLLPSLLKKWDALRSRGAPRNEAT